MRFYETLYIVNPNLEKDQLGKIMDDVNEEFQKNNGAVINHYVWGKKRLAYPIQKHRYGNYILAHFSSKEMQFLLDLEMYLKLNTAVLRHQTVRLDEEPEVVEVNEIEEENETSESEEGSKEEAVNKEEPLVSETSATVEEDKEKTDSLSEETESETSEPENKSKE
jgi:small subunit ribosomal protein S6